MPAFWDLGLRQVKGHFNILSETKQGPVRPPNPRTRGLRPLDPFSGYCLNERIKLVPTVAERNTEV